MRRLHIVPVVLAGLAMFLSACTTVPEAYKLAEPYECPPEECDPPEPVGPGGELVVEGGEFYFEILEGEDSVQEGTVRITFDNVGGAEHNFTIDEAFGDVKAVPPDANTPPGETDEGELELFAGTWTYYCSVPGHRSAGMVGTITVAPATGGAAVTEGEDAEETEDGDDPEDTAGAATPGEGGEQESPTPAVDPEPDETET